MTKEELISQITSTISANGNQDITGTKLQEVLISIVDTLYSAIDDVIIDASPEDFTELILQSLGTRKDATMSQKAITDALTALNYGINAIPVFARIDRIDVDLGQAPSIINSSTELPGEIVYLIYAHPYLKEGFYWKASDNKYYAWFADAHLYKVDTDTPVRYNKLFECAEDGKQYVIISGSTIEKPNLVMLGAGSGSAVVESNDIPKFNGIINDDISIVEAFAQTYEGVYFSVLNSTFVAKLGADYYAQWDTSQYYKNEQAVISNRLFEYNKQQYVFENGTLNLVGSGGDIPDMSDYATKTYVDDKVSNIEIKAGSFKSAQQKAKDDNGLWMWMLEESEIKKPIWHIGSGAFIDAVGAEVFIEPELNVFKYTAILTQDNDTIVVPTLPGRVYDMVVDWGDGSDVQSVSGLISLKALTHTYTGAAGTKYQITLKGVVPGLAFGGGDTVYSEPAQLYSIDENTLQNDIKMTTSPTFDADFRNCINLVHISEDAVHNLKPKTKICFQGCSSLKSLPPRLLDGFELISLPNFVAGCSVLELSEDFMNNLAQKISGVTTLLYAFQGCKGKIHIPDNFFDNIVGNIVDVRQMTLNATGVTGDAKKLYDSLSTKVTSENVLGCFSGANLSNRDQVPTAWGGTMK